MRKIAKNLCVWAMSLAAAGMISSCDNGPEPTFPSVNLNNQIWYEELTTDIKSAAYDEHDGVYTFYLSPTAGLTTIQGFTEADDYVAIQTNNPNGVQTIEDNFAIDYKNVSIASIAMSKNVKEWKLDVSLNSDGTLTLNAAGAMVTGDKVMAKYNGPCPEAVFDPGLNNEFFYRASKKAIKTVLYYEEPEGVFTYYLSPTEGLTTIQEMLADDQYFKIVTDANNSWTAMAYKETDIEKNSDAIKKAEFKLTNQDGNMNLDMSVRLKTGLRMLAKYTGPCAEALYYPELENQCQNDRTIMTMGSVVVEHNFATMETTYNVYEETGVTAVDETKTLVVKVTAPLGTDITSVNLAEPENVTMTVGGATPVSGTLAWEVLTDRVSGVVEGISVSLDGRDANDNIIRVEYEGDFATTAKAEKENNFTTNHNEEVAAPLAKVFMEKGTGSIKLVFGTNSEANGPAQLMAENHFAAELTISETVLNKEAEFITIDLTDKANSFKVYDYTKFSTWDNSRTYAVSQSDVKSGTLKIAKVGDVYCWNLTAELGVNENTSYAMTMSSDWCGAVTKTTIPDMVPVAPTNNMFQILASDGVSIYNGYYRDITGVEVAKAKGKDTGSIPEASEFYVFFFKNQDTETNGITSRYGTPFLRIKADQIGKEINIADEYTALEALKANTSATTEEKMAVANSAWRIEYNPFSSSKPGTPHMNGYAYGSLYNSGTIKVDFDDNTKKAKITVKVQDQYMSWGSAQGSKKWIEISFDGTCTVFSGSVSYSTFSFGSASGFEKIW